MWHFAVKYVCLYQCCYAQMCLCPAKRKKEKEKDGLRSIAVGDSPCTPDRMFHCQPPRPTQRSLQGPTGGKKATWVKMVCSHTAAWFDLSAYGSMGNAWCNRSASSRVRVTWNSFICLLHDGGVFGCQLRKRKRRYWEELRLHRVTVSKSLCAFKL